MNLLINSIQKLTGIYQWLQKSRHRLFVPLKLHRNHPSVLKAGPEKTGAILMNLVCQTLGLDSLAETDVLDVGCGVRFTQTIINLKLPIKSYTGIDVHKELIDFLNNNVKDSRFSFFHWNIRNELYNKDGEIMSAKTALPIDKSKTFDLIWLFSVFTHLNPADSENLLHILRRYIKNDGHLFFTAFIDNAIDEFEDRVKERPLEQAYYNEKIIKEMLTRTRWRVTSINEKDPDNYIQHYFVCTPVT